MPSRREFLERIGQISVAGAGLCLFGCARSSDEVEAAPTPKTNTKELKAKLAVAEGTDYKRLLTKATDEFGGLDSLVPSGGTVVIKPNMAWDRSPKYAANTNPELIGALVSLVLASGADKVKVFDYPCADKRLAYKNSGIAAAAEDAGADVSFIDEVLFKKVAVADGKALKNISLYAEIDKADMVINVPIAKTHSIAGLTMGMKNLMGVIGGNRGAWHSNIDKKLVDLVTLVKPELTILDATRVMTAGGPTGGDLANVRKDDKIIVGTDYVAVDAYGASALFDWDPLDLGVVKEAANRSLGASKLSNITIKEIT